MSSLQTVLALMKKTFNYPPVEEIPYCLKLICPFWLLPRPKGLSVSYFYSAPALSHYCLFLHANTLKRIQQMHFVVKRKSQDKLTTNVASYYKPNKACMKSLHDSRGIISFV